MGLREVTYLAVFLRIFAAALVGGLLGLERGLKNRAAGLRTYMLVCVGSCLVMLTNQYIYQSTATGDPVRMAAQVVSGIGFLGAGTIIVTKHNQIKGLTTAAGLWSAAGVGLALGIGFYEAAVVGALAIFIVMTLLQRIDNRMRSNTKRLDVYLELSDEVSLGAFLTELRNRNFEVSNVLQESSDRAAGTRGYSVTMKMESRHKHPELLAEIQKMNGVVYLEEL